MREDMRRRLALLSIAQPIMERVLRLPEGYEIVDSFSMHERWAHGFVLRSPAFQVQPHGVTLPEVQVELHPCPTCHGPVFENVVYPADPLAARVVDMSYFDEGQA